MLDFSLRQLEIFVTAAERNSFTRAAEELYLTQSTVSAHISGLEHALGTPLFLRNTRRRVCLTEEGRRLYPEAKKILLQCRGIRDLLQDRGSEPPLALGASTVPAQCLLPELLSEFLKKRPDCRYLLRRGDSAHIHALLRSGEIRVGFVGTVLDREALIYRPMAEDRLVLVTQNSERYRRLQEAGAFGRDLLGEAVIAREEGSGTERTLDRYLGQIGLPQEKLRIVARIDNPEAIKNFVAKGVGVSVLSELAVQEEVAAGKLLAFPMDREGLVRSIYMVFPKNGPGNRTEREFIAFVESRAQSPKAGRQE